MRNLFFIICLLTAFSLNAQEIATSELYQDTFAEQIPDLQAEEEFLKEQQKILRQELANTALAEIDLKTSEKLINNIYERYLKMTPEQILPRLTLLTQQINSPAAQRNKELLDRLKIEQEIATSVYRSKANK